MCWASFADSSTKLHQTSQLLMGNDITEKNWTNSLFKTFETVENFHHMWNWREFSSNIIPWCFINDNIALHIYDMI